MMVPKVCKNVSVEVLDILGLPSARCMGFKIEFDHVKLPEVVVRYSPTQEQAVALARHINGRKSDA